jgi:hypothetical protein
MLVGSLNTATSPRLGVSARTTRPGKSMGQQLIHVLPNALNEKLKEYLL